MIHPLFSAPLLADLPPVAAEAMLALRILVVAQQRGVDAVPLVFARFGTAAATCEFLEFAREAAAAWPDDFTIHPPCCARLTADEILLAQLLVAAVEAAPLRFHQAARDFLGEACRERLWRRALLFVAALDVKAPQRLEKTRD